MCMAKLPLEVAKDLDALGLLLQLDPDSRMDRVEEIGAAVLIVVNDLIGCVTIGQKDYDGHMCDVATVPDLDAILHSVMFDAWEEVPSDQRTDS